MRLRCEQGVRAGDRESSRWAGGPSDRDLLMQLCRTGVQDTRLTEKRPQWPQTEFCRKTARDLT